MTATTAPPSPTSATLDLRIAPARRRREAIVRLLFLAAAALSIVISGGIVFTLIGNAMAFAVQVDPAALWTDGWFPRRGMYDIKTIVAGTLVTVSYTHLTLPTNREV